MLVVNGPNVESDVLEWARDWFDLLAAGDLAEACARLDDPNHYGVVWTPQAIAGLVAETFGTGTRFRGEHPEGPEFTGTRAASGRERFAFGGFADGTGFWFNYDVPLNGGFSDLTAAFELYWRAPRTLAVRLHDLLVT
jgi:hypothetical protein